MSAEQTRNRAGLSDEQLQTLRARLERRRDEVRARLVKESAVPRQSEPLVEPLEAAEQTREQDDAISLADHDRTLLGEIERALRKLSTGDYGLSEISGDPIPYQRLIAVPWARYDSDEVDESGRPAESP
jgi:DnaK suppressor protein